MTMRIISFSVMKFLVSMFIMTIICSIVWEKFVYENIYDCTDDEILPGYLNPNGWVGNNNWPVVVVKQVVPGRPMSGPDQIKEGWSIAGLWVLWFLFFVTSLLISILFAWVRWSRQPRLYIPRSPG